MSAISSPYRLRKAECLVKEAVLAAYSAASAAS
jgi:hypothetical protein